VINQSRDPFSKPGWVRVVGYLALLCGLVPILVPLAEVTSGVRIPRTVWPGYCFLAFWPLIILWIIASLSHRVHVRRARLNAAAMMEAARQSQMRPPAAPGR
jgi:hypothetical protein